MCMCGTCGMLVPERTSLGRCMRATERPATAAVSAGARQTSPVAEPQPQAAVVAIQGSPVRVGEGGEGTGGCWVLRSQARCGGAGAVCTLAEVW